mgnify:CR=1
MHFIESINIIPLLIIISAIIFLFVVFRATQKSSWWIRGVTFVATGVLCLVYLIYFAVNVECYLSDYAMKCGLGSSFWSFLLTLLFIGLGFMFFFVELIKNTKKKK